MFYNCCLNLRNQPDGDTVMCLVTSEPWRAPSAKRSQKKSLGIRSSPVRSGPQTTRLSEALEVVTGLPVSRGFEGLGLKAKIIR